MSVACSREQHKYQRRLRPLSFVFLSQLLSLLLFTGLAARTSAVPISPARTVGLICLNATPAAALLKGTFCESFIKWRIFVNESDSGDVAAKAAAAQQAYKAHLSQLGDVRSALPPNSDAIKLSPSSPRIVQCYSLLAYYE